MRAKASIHAGVCGFKTTVKARSDDSQHVRFEVESTSPKITEMARGLSPVDGYQEIADGFGGVVHACVREAIQ